MKYLRIDRAGDAAAYSQRKIKAFGFGPKVKGCSDSTEGKHVRKPLGQVVHGHSPYETSSEENKNWELGLADINHIVDSAHLEKYSHKSMRRIPGHSSLYARQLHGAAVLNSETTSAGRQ